ncbi:primosomal protein N' [Prevotella loescheii]|nr:primosomal protein N' [Hoylesella loescheii]
MRYADIILPLGLEGLFTYSVPDSLAGRVMPFVRVVVPLGRSKVYTGLVARLHDVRPQPRQGRDGKLVEVEVKDIIDVIDSAPVLLDYQYRLWQWISEYYLCPIGDVFRAAFPAGMKQEEGYRPKTETYIRLAENYRTEAALHAALNMLRRAQKQMMAFNTYLYLSHYDTLEGDTTTEKTVEITREELINVSRTTDSVVRSLVGRGFLEAYEVPVGRLNYHGEYHPEQIKPLSPAQQRAFDDIQSASKPVLLQGVTGSGKTEIYIRLIKEEIERGRQVLYLLPEIALTVQIMQRLQSVFGDRLGIYHSRYSDAERVEIWQRQLSDNPYDVILGARSAIFLPFSRLGLVIIDEEHEQSFKQQDPAPRYHARSVALVMQRILSAPSAPSSATLVPSSSASATAVLPAKNGQRQPAAVRVVMGTATPSLESYHNAISGKYHLVVLAERYKGMQLPETVIVDIADLQRRKMMYGPFSPQLVDAMRQTIADGRQVILFQNRRGFAPLVECHECGWVPKCKNCDVSLTMHKVEGQLRCHYCGYTYPIPDKCPSCFSRDIRQRGYGTEKVEERLAELGFSRIARMDLDTTRTKNAYERIINDFSAGRTQILIGTQMVSKGLDFENVSIVGILDADTMLNYPDFRAYEQAFQMLCQVSGRAGRQGRRGVVYLQTRHPDLPVIRQVVENDFPAFFREQCDERQMFSYPPFTRVVYIYLRHSKDNLVESASIEMGGRLRQYFGQRVLGPDKPPVSRIKSLSIRKLVLKLELGIDLVRVRQCLRHVRDALLSDKRYASMQVFYDVDPQ